MEAAPREDVTMLLEAMAGGDARAGDQLLPLIYEELQSLARSLMARESPGQTLQPTALVHEAYLRLMGQADMKWDCRGHFFVAAATAMRRILVERARSRRRLKRGGGRGRVELDDAALRVEPPDDDLLALDEALEHLEGYDGRQHQVVMLRYFAGLSVEETASALGLSETTVKSDWAYARAWLHRRLSRAESSDGQDASP